MMKFFWALFLIPYLGGCSSVSTSFIGGRLESSETVGKKGKARFGVGLAQGENVTITDDASSRPVTLNTPYSTSISEDLLLNFGVALINNLDVIGKYDPASSSALGLKFQLLGEPFSEAKEGNFSLSLTGVPRGITPCLRSRRPKRFVWSRWLRLAVALR